MLVVAGLSLKNLSPRVWDPSSLYYLPTLRAVMLSYADFHRMPARRHQAMEYGLQKWLGVPEHVSVYLDNGAFYFLDRGGEAPRQEYEQFVARARPDWWPIPQDFIPTPRMTDAEQHECFQRTMAVNQDYCADGYIPVIHISRLLTEYLEAIRASSSLAGKPGIALGGIVPNLLRASKAMPYTEVLEGLKRVREAFAGKQIHVFGIGGTATLHLAALLGVDSVDSSGWRNRAARGIVQLPGRGDRMIAKMGSWRGREADDEDWHLLGACHCPACERFGPPGLKASGIGGFCNRATHNLATLLAEEKQIGEHLHNGTYRTWYGAHVENSIYKPLIDYLL